jgi:uncharacterized membrane protein
VYQGFKKLNIRSEVVERMIEDFESELDFELIPVIAKKSSYVEHISWVISLVFLLVFLAAIEWYFAVHLSDSWTARWPIYIALPFVSFAFGVALDKSDLIDRFFISKRERSRQADEKAELFFYRRRLHEIKSKNALLLYISLMERHIVLFHDPRIQFDQIEKIEQEMLSILQQSFKNGHFEKGLVDAIRHLKTALLPHFKREKLLENSFPNKLIWLQD